jgi:hypothetical protein
MLGATIAAAFALSAAPAWGQEEGEGLKVNLDLPFDAGGLEDNDEEPPEAFVFYNQTFEGDGVFFCLDRSSSTANGELNNEKREAIRVIQEFSDRVEFGVVFYDKDVLKWPTSGQPAQATETNKSAGRAFLLSTQVGGGSCVKGGLLECLNYVARSSANRNIVIWLGDGCTTCMNMNVDTYAQQTLTEVKARNFKRAQINAVCVGTADQVCESFPKSLASMNNGAYSRVTR